jgi:hypothetical protein
MVVARYFFKKTDALNTVKKMNGYGQLQSDNELLELKTTGIITD